MNSPDSRELSLRMCTITHAIETRPYFNRSGFEARLIIAAGLHVCESSVGAVAITLYRACMHIYNYAVPGGICPGCLSVN